MNFSFDESTTMLGDSIDRFLSAKYTLQKRAAITGDAVNRRQLWQEMAELGWIGAAIPEAAGGYASSPMDTYMVAERFGRHLVVEPFVANAVVCGHLLSTAAPEEAREGLLAGLIKGAVQWAPAIGGDNLLHRPEISTFTAQCDGDGYVIRGRKSVVLNADIADRLIVAARTSGADGDRQGITLFIVDMADGKVTRRAYRLIDAQGAAEVVLDGVRVGRDAVLGEPDNGVPLADRAFDHGIAAVCAEAVGSMTHLVHATADYTKTREQYGQPLAKFQVLQHRLADMYIQTETARSMAYLGALALDGDAGDRAGTLSAAKIQVAKSAAFVGYQAVQLHGGMGVSEELDIGHHFVRLSVIGRQFGDKNYHLTRFSRLDDCREAG